MLYIVATPIGNLEDITLRALRILKEADIIAAEDTRRTIKLLNHYDIKTRLLSFHEHSGEGRRTQIIDELKAGKNVALVSDAGTPLISDPGAELVKEAAQEGIEITSLPGACAAVTAYTLSGFSGAFTFIGFLSKKASERKAEIESIAKSELPLILYESPHGLKATLEDIAGACGAERRVAIAKELTKVHESVLRATAKEACDYYSGQIKGEYVVIVDAAQAQVAEVTDEQIKAELERCIKNGMTKKDAATAASSKLNVNKNRAYKLTI